MKEHKDSIIFTLGIIIIMLIAIFGANFQYKQDEKNYNQGICTLCDGYYIFSGTAHIKNSGDLYYYTCDKCNHTIKVHHIMR